METNVANASYEMEEPATILVVDDEVLVRMVVADYLRDCGYRVLEAGNGDEAVAVLEAESRVSVVFSDVQMPGLDGFGLSRWVRANRPGVGVILTSGGVKAAHAAEDLCEAGPLVAKPYGVQDVVERIRAHLGRV